MGTNISFFLSFFLLHLLLPLLLPLLPLLPLLLPQLANMYLLGGDHASLRRVILELHRSCQLEDGSDDVSKGSNLLEVYALQIQMYVRVRVRDRVRVNLLEVYALQRVRCIKWG